MSTLAVDIGGTKFAVALFFTSESGKQLIAYGRDSTKEVKKVVWPTRKEAMQMTGYVFQKGHRSLVYLGFKCCRSDCDGDH